MAGASSRPNCLVLVLVLVNKPLRVSSCRCTQSADAIVNSSYNSIAQKPIPLWWCFFPIIICSKFIDEREQRATEEGSEREGEGEVRDVEAARSSSRFVSFVLRQVFHLSASLIRVATVVTEVETWKLRCVISSGTDCRQGMRCGSDDILWHMLLWCHNWCGILHWVKRPTTGPPCRHRNESDEYCFLRKQIISIILLRFFASAFPPFHLSRPLTSLVAMTVVSLPSSNDVDYGRRRLHHFHISGNTIKIKPINSNRKYLRCKTYFTWRAPHRSNVWLAATTSTREEFPLPPPPSHTSQYLLLAQIHAMCN